MANYIDSLNKGLIAARDAERNREEVNGVFNELNEQLSSATDNKVAIRRMQFNGPVDLAKAIDGSLSAFFTRSKYWVLAAVFLPDGKVEATELAKWDQDNNGYPCRVSFGANTYFCDDKVALETAMGTLLADSAVGEVLHRYMTMPLPRAEK